MIHRGVSPEHCKLLRCRSIGILNWNSFALSSSFEFDRKSRMANGCRLCRDRSCLTPVPALLICLVSDFLNLSVSGGGKLVCMCRMLSKHRPCHGDGSRQVDEKRRSVTGSPAVQGIKEGGGTRKVIEDSPVISKSGAGAGWIPALPPRRNSASLCRPHGKWHPHCLCRHCLCRKLPRLRRHLGEPCPRGHY